VGSRRPRLGCFLRCIIWKHRSVLHAAKPPAGKDTLRATKITASTIPIFCWPVRNHDGAVPRHRCRRVSSMPARGRRAGDLDLRKTRGARGIRVHTRTSTLARLDVGHSRRISVFVSLSISVTAAAVSPDGRCAVRALSGGDESAALFIVPVIVRRLYADVSRGGRPGPFRRRRRDAQLWQPPLDVSIARSVLRTVGTGKRARRARDLHAPLTRKRRIQPRRRRHRFGRPPMACQTGAAFTNRGAEGPPRSLLSRVLATARRPTSSLSTASNRARIRSSWGADHRVSVQTRSLRK